MSDVTRRRTEVRRLQYPPTFRRVGIWRPLAKKKRRRERRSPVAQPFLAVLLSNPQSQRRYQTHPRSADEFRCSLRLAENSFNREFSRTGSCQIWRPFVLVLQAEFVPIVRSKKGTRNCASRSIPLRARGFYPSAWWRTPRVESYLPNPFVRFAGVPCGAGASRVGFRGAGVRDSPYRRQPRALVTASGLLAARRCVHFGDGHSTDPLFFFLIPSRLLRGLTLKSEQFSVRERTAFARYLVPDRWSRIDANFNVEVQGATCET